MCIRDRQTVDDMVTLYVIADEQKLIEKLPAYAAANLLRIPFMNADSMDVVHMALPYLTLPYLRGAQVVTRKDISVLSCFETKSWLRGEEKDKVTAFRVCVSADHRTKLMDGNLWSKGIILRDWKFNGKLAPQNGVQH